MISIAEINRVASKYQVPAETIEKDYIISWILWSLSASAIKDDFIFYGGTALKRIYFEDHRFSEDIDLISEKKFSKEKLMHNLSCLEKIKDEANIEVILDKNFHSIQSREIMYLHYEGFDEIVGAPKEIKIDFNMNATIFGNSQTACVIESYSDLKDKRPLLNVMTINTILANKIGMLFDIARDEPRDIYDIWFLLNRQSQFELNFNKILSIIKEKYSFRPTIKMIKDKLKMQQHWQTRLQKQIANLPEQHIVTQEIMYHLENNADFWKLTMKPYLWTLDGGRLHYQSAYKTSEVNWMFVPGGPGFGSEALSGLTQLIKDKIPGVIWHFDFPNDGSNILQDKSILNWHISLTQAINALDKVILVAHSTPGMFVQTMPELENVLHGLVLIGSAPDASWQNSFGEYCKTNRDPMIVEAENNYTENPNNETLRKLLISAAKNCFVTEKSLLEGRELFRRIPINHCANELVSKIFDSENYKATWVPQKVPTLITTGSNDHITPLSLFTDNKMYQSDNILIKEISGAGHYPWFENPNEVVHAFLEYFRKLNDSI